MFVLSNLPPVPTLIVNASEPGFWQFSKVTLPDKYANTLLLQCRDSWNDFFVPKIFLVVKFKRPYFKNKILAAKQQSRNNNSRAKNFAGQGGWSLSDSSCSAAIKNKLRVAAMHVFYIYQALVVFSACWKVREWTLWKKISCLLFNQYMSPVFPVFHNRSNSEYCSLK